MALLGAAALAIVLLAVGARIRERLRLPCPPSLHGAVEWCLGCWTVGVAVLGCGLVGWLKPVPILILVGALASLGSYKGLWRKFRRVLPYLAASIPLAPVVLAPPFFYDALVYHLGLPWQALQEQAIRAHPENVFSAFPPLAQLLYAVPLSLGLMRVPALMHLLTFCLGAQAVTSLARRLGAGRAPATIAGLFFLYSPIAFVVPALPAAEGWTLAGVASAAAIALTVRPVRARAGLTGLLVGIALAARLQGAAWVVLLGLTVVGLSRGRVRSAAAFVAGALAGSLPWWSKNALLLGQPLAPIGWKREGIETLWRDGQSLLYRSSGLFDLAVQAWERAVSLPHLLLPPLILALLGAWDRRSSAALLAAFLGIAGVGVWLVTGTLGRFLLPSFALLLAVAAAPRKPVLASVASAVIAVGTVWGLMQTLDFYERKGAVALLRDAETVYHEQVVANPFPAYGASSRLPEDARILVVAEPRGFLLPRPFVTTSQHDPTPLRELLATRASASAVVAELRRRGFTHLLLNTAEMNRLGARYPVLPWVDEVTRARHTALLTHLGQPVIREGPVVVYALPHTDPASSISNGER